VKSLGKHEMNHQIKQYSSSEINIEVTIHHKKVSFLKPSRLISENPKQKNGAK